MVAKSKPTWGAGKPKSVVHDGFRRVDASAAAEAEDEMKGDAGDFFASLDPRAKRARRDRQSGDPDSAKFLRTEEGPVPIVDRSGDQTQSSILWLELGLCKALVRAVTHLGFLAPTPVQAAAVPAGIEGYDVCARAVTGSGKTAAFLLPALHRILTNKVEAHRKRIRCLILVPSRELGVQCEKMAKDLIEFTNDVKVMCAIGGVSVQAQMRSIIQSPDILIATPGRLVDLLHNEKGIDLSGIELFILDECDKMVTVTLKDQVVDIANRLPEQRQTLMFSATMTDDVDHFATEFLYEPKNIDIGHVALASQLRQQFVRVAHDGDVELDPTTKAPLPANEEHMVKIKTRYLVALCSTTFTERVLIFAKYRTTVHRLNAIFNALKMHSVELQGEQSQEQRLAAYNSFRTGSANFLFCTDVASRGLDMPEVRTVINFDMPATLTAYIHRVGRTARIGAAGTAASLVEEVLDHDIMKKIIVVSNNKNKHQAAEVKRRVISEEDLADATSRINDVFPQVKASLRHETVERGIEKAERKLSNFDDALKSTILAKPQKKWCLSKEELRKRDEKAKKTFQSEAEVRVEQLESELKQLEEKEVRFLEKRVAVKRNEKEKALDRKLAEKAKRKAERAKEPMKKGLLKKQRVAKVRQAKRKEKRELKRDGKLPPKKAPRKKAVHKKSRHNKKKKKH